MNYEVFWEANSLIEKLTFVYMDALKKALKAIVWAGSLVSWKKGLATRKGDNSKFIQFSMVAFLCLCTRRQILIFLLNSPLQNTTDQSCLKGFLRFQGLSLLWSWMVDGGEKKPKLRREVKIRV